MQRAASAGLCREQYLIQDAPGSRELAAEQGIWGGAIVTLTRVCTQLAAGSARKRVLCETAVTGITAVSAQQISFSGGEKTILYEIAIPAWYGIR
jgi:hypothetical protein